MRGLFSGMAAIFEYPVTNLRDRTSISLFGPVSIANQITFVPVPMSDIDIDTEKAFVSLNEANAVLKGEWLNGMW